VDYASTQTGLGDYYLALARTMDSGDAEATLNKAISAYNESLKIFTIDNYPGDYAAVQEALAQAYEELAQFTDKEENLSMSQKAKEEAEKAKK
jgi:hypothetical protein